MKRILFTSDDAKLKIDADTKNQFKSGLSNERVILKKRSKKYIKLFSSIDHDTLKHTQGFQELMEAIKEEFGTAELADLPIGIVGKCFLGHPYEVHILDLTAKPPVTISQVIRHYKISESMPGDLEKARTLALHNAYCFIEVYKDKMVLIREDGSVTIL